MADRAQLDRSGVVGSAASVALYFDSAHDPLAADLACWYASVLDHLVDGLPAYVQEFAGFGHAHQVARDARVVAYGHGWTVPQALDKRQDEVRIVRMPESRLTRVAHLTFIKYTRHNGGMRTTTKTAPRVTVRLRRTCYDKPHRCPGWAGGGWRFPKPNRVVCQSGSLRTMYAGRWWRWQFHRHPTCGTVALPPVTKWLDPSWWWYLVTCRLPWSVRDWCESRRSR